VRSTLLCRRDSYSRVLSSCCSWPDSRLFLHAQLPVLFDQTFITIFQNSVGRSLLKRDLLSLLDSSTLPFWALTTSSRTLQLSTWTFPGPAHLLLVRVWTRVIPLFILPFLTYSPFAVLLSQLSSEPGRDMVGFWPWFSAKWGGVWGPSTRYTLFPFHPLYYPLSSPFLLFFPNSFPPSVIPPETNLIRQWRWGGPQLIITVIVFFFRVVFFLGGFLTLGYPALVLFFFFF